jgi:hypothetical protein
MANHNWSYVQNPFDNATKRNFKKMLRLSTDHFHKLESAIHTDIFVKQLYLEAVPAFEQYTQTFQNAITFKAAYRMHTNKLERQMELLSSDKIKRWDIQIQSVYLDTDPEYLAILPNHRTPFQKGAYEMRVNECFSLAAKIAAFPALNQTQTDVLTFSQLLKQTRNDQQSAEKQVADVSTNLEKARLKLAKAMQKVFAGLMYYYSDELEKVENFYELQHLRATNTTNKDEDKDELEPTKIVEDIIPETAKIALFENEMTADTEILIQNTSNVTLEAWTAESIQELAPTRKLMISPNQTATCFAREFTTGRTKTLILNNTDNTTGTYKVAIYVPKVEENPAETAG